MGLLDNLFSSDSGGLFGALYPTQAGMEANSAQDARDAYAAALARKMRGAMNPDSGPSSFISPAPAVPQGPVGDPAVFGGGASPFSFNAGLLPQAPASGPIAGMPAITNPVVPSSLPAAVAAAPQALPQNTYQYGGLKVPVFGQPDPAAIPPTAQYAQGALPDGTPPSFMQAPSGVGIGDRISAGLQNFANAGGPLQALFGGAAGLISGQRNDAAGMQQQNLKAQYDALVPLLGPNKAMLAVMNPKAAEILLQDALGDKTPPKSVDEFVARQLANGKSPQEVQRIIEWDQQRKAQEAALKTKATTEAEAQGKTAATLPVTLPRIENAIANIDAISNHPNKNANLGWGSLIPPIPGGKGVDFVERVDQVKAQSFLQMYDQLRGAGAITEKEGEKATAAQARLNRAKSPEDFDAALKDLREVLVNAYSNIQRTAGTQPQPYGMQPGQTRDFGGGVSIKRVR